MTRLSSKRHGVTLIELLVVMAIITALGLLALMLMPGLVNTDSVLKGAEEVRAQCKVAQALAAGARQPRGVRLLYTPGATQGNRFATELQLLEAPQITVFDPFTLVARGSNATGVNGPRVEIFYELYSGTEPSVDPLQPGTPPPGSIKLRHCQFFGLTQPQLDQIGPGSLLVLPTLGFWARIKDYPTAVNGGAVEVPLELYPDTFLGASTHYRTYHAGIYGPPVPLLGQPTIPLPKNIAVDLDMSAPPGPGNNGQYDIMFAPDGQMISVRGSASNAGVYLWVRDVSKITLPGGGVNQFSMYPPHFGGRNANWAAAFRRGGEQHAVGINNGFVGTEAILWPDAAGAYPANSDEFFRVRQKLK